MKKNSNFFFVGLVFLFLFSNLLKSTAELEKDYFIKTLESMNLPEIPLVKPLIETPGMKNIHDKFILRLISLLKKNDNFHRAEFIPECLNLIKEFSTIIFSNPNNKLSLTLKFYIGVCVFWSHEIFSNDLNIWERIVCVATNIFKSIYEDFPDSWQGKFYLIFSRNLLFAVIKNNPKAKISELEKIIGTFHQIDKIPEFIDFRKIIGPDYPCEVGIYEIIIYSWLRLKNFQAAENKLNELTSLNIAPQSVLKRLKQEIEIRREKILK